MTPNEKLAFMLRQRARVHKWSGRNNEPGYEDKVEELAQAVVRDEFIELARLLEAEKGFAVQNKQEQREYEKLKEEQDT